MADLAMPAGTPAIPPDGLMRAAAVNTARRVLDASQRLDLDAVHPAVLASHLGALQLAILQLLDVYEPEGVQP